MREHQTEVLKHFQHIYIYTYIYILKYITYVIYDSLYGLHH